MGLINRNAGSKPVRSGKAATKKAPATNAASHILSAPKGPRTLTHREIEQAIRKVFKDRYGADA